MWVLPIKKQEGSPERCASVFLLILNKLKLICSSVLDNVAERYLLDTHLD